MLKLKNSCIWYHIAKEFFAVIIITRLFLLYQQKVLNFSYTCIYLRKLKKRFLNHFFLFYMEISSGKVLYSQFYIHHFFYMKKQFNTDDDREVQRIKQNNLNTFSYIHVGLSSYKIWLFNPLPFRCDVMCLHPSGEDQKCRLTK